MRNWEGQVREGKTALKWGKQVGGIYTLVYADDVAILVEDEEAIKVMLGRLEKYLDKKGLELNIGKTKVMKCRKGGGRRSRVNWRWKGRAIEEASEFNYFGYVNYNGKQEGHIRERVRTGAALLGQVWGIGMRRFKENWCRRVWLFNKLIWSVIGYVVEMWGWKKREGLERLHDRFLKWVFGVMKYSPGKGEVGKNKGI